MLLPRGDRFTEMKPSDLSAADASSLCNQPGALGRPRVRRRVKGGLAIELGWIDKFRGS
jgi:hypothetical protein